MSMNSHVISIDLVVGLRIGTDLTLKFKGKNLLNEPIIQRAGDQIQAKGILERVSAWDSSTHPKRHHPPKNLNIARPEVFGEHRCYGNSFDSLYQMAVLSAI